MGFNHFGKGLDKIANMDTNVDLFGRDSDSDSESSEASTTEENAPFPGGGAANAPFPLGGAAGGFLGQVEDAVAMQEGRSGSEEGGGAEAGGGGTDAAPPREGKAREGEEEVQEEDSRPVYKGKADTLFKMLDVPTNACEEPDIAKVRELLDAGIDVRYQVRVRSVCLCVLSIDTHE